MEADQQQRGTPMSVEQRIQPYLARIAETFDRISRLLDLYDERLTEHEIGEDVLRAAVVFTHAHLEDFLRTLASELLPAGDEDCLKDIPLAGTGSFGRSEKFALGQLAQHRGKTVDELLRQSVSDYLARSNYNSTTDIAALLSKLGFEIEPFQLLGPVIKGANSAGLGRNQ